MEKLILILTFLITLISCHVSREGSNLLIIQNETTSIDLLNHLESVYPFDEVDIVSDMSILEDDSINKYRVIAALIDDQFEYLPIHQTSVERYVQSGGGLLIPSFEVNKFHWPWMHRLMKREEAMGSYDGGKYLILKEQLPKKIEAIIGDNVIHKSAVKSQKAPKPDRFITNILNQDLYEPIEMEILPDNKVLIMERRGKMKIYDPLNSETSVIADFDVCIEGNYEDGLLGLELDPDFEFNNYIYIYYSPPCDNTNQLLSRFVLLNGDSLLMSSERVIMEVPVQRETCCHSSGELMFDRWGHLWLSTGDNTSSKESDGYSPIDERPGRGPFDAQKSSGNTHDLRGKILRIMVNEDATYDIPDGNLFPKDGSEGRPEIYVMGARNPYRFTVDDRTGFLYWGDVGPDAGKDSKYGSQSYDEWNQARSPGYYGWPYFMANNIAFPDRDFESGQVGSFFDPLNPINDSPFNTGSRQLPPAKPAMIWYPYGQSDQFPMLGNGSRSAMAGPFYRKPRKPSKVAFPEYFQDKLFIFEWARSWIKVLTFDGDENLYKIEPFLPDFKFSKPIDIKFGNDGAMYVLDYGVNYFANNDDARLAKIEYWENNIPPVAKITADKTLGAAPLEVSFSSEESYDLDKNSDLTYHWYINGERTYEGKVAKHTFNTPGVHGIMLMVTDSEGGEGSQTTLIKVGNEPSDISIELAGNNSFYFGNETRSYRVAVNDLEDGSTIDGTLADHKINVQFNFMSQGLDIANLGPDLFSGVNLENLKGKLLMESSDCGSCHSMDQKSIGPSYLSIATKYKGSYDAPAYLAQKIINGGNGVWGEAMMSGHPQHTLVETDKMARYVLSLANKQASSRDLNGIVVLNRHIPKSHQGSYLLTVSYIDEPSNGMPSNISRDILVLRSPRVEAEDYDYFKNVARLNNPQTGYQGIRGFNDQAYFGYKNVDLSGLTSVVLRIMPYQEGNIILKTGSSDGKEIGSADISKSSKPTEVKIKFAPHAVQTDVFFVMEKGDALVDWVEFKKGSATSTTDITL